MKKIFLTVVLGIVTGSTAFAQGCIMDAEKAQTNDLGYAVGTSCPEFTIKSALSTSLELTDSSNGMCTPEYSVVIDNNRYSVYLFNPSKEVHGVGVGCKLKVNFKSGVSSSLLLQVNRD